MRKKGLLIIVIIIGLLGIVSIILANQKSPQPSKNLLEYIIYHKIEWQCLDERGDNHSSTSGSIRWTMPYGDRVKDYYFGIPILKNSCPEGTVAEN